MFGEDNSTPVMEVLAPSALESQERAAIDMQIATAKRHPRGDVAKIRQRMVDLATLDQDTAAACFYTLKRKAENGEQKIIEGPSIRLAEIALVCWGNVRAAARVIENDGKKVTCQGICIDLESNVAISVEVQRRITTRSGQTYGEDMQIVTSNAGNAIALRNAILKLIPGAIIKQVFDKAKQASIGNGSILIKWQNAVKVFTNWSVTEAELLWYVERTSTKDLEDDDVVKLRGLLTALKDNDTSVQDTFGEFRNSRGSAEASAAVAEEKLAKIRADDAEAKAKAGQKKEPVKEEPPPVEKTEESADPGPEQGRPAETTATAEPAKKPSFGFTQPRKPLH